MLGNNSKPDEFFTNFMNKIPPKKYTANRTKNLDNKDFVIR